MQLFKNTQVSWPFLVSWPNTHKRSLVGSATQRTSARLAPAKLGVATIAGGERGPSGRAYFATGWGFLLQSRFARPGKFWANFSERWKNVVNFVEPVACVVGIDSKSTTPAALKRRTVSFGREESAVIAAGAQMFRFGCAIEQDLFLLLALAFRRRLIQAYQLSHSSTHG